MKDWKNSLVSIEATLQETVARINELSPRLQTALVVDGEGRLQGTVTDGDVRRALIRGVPFESSVRAIMNTEPTSAPLGVPPEEVAELMRVRRLQVVPLLDESGRVCGAFAATDSLRVERRENLAVIIAGGLGTRLRPLTEECPKPMLRVGEKPILQTILEGLISQGFHSFVFAGHYRAEQIRDYFGDGERWNVEIRYVEEKKRLGTAGPLTLLQERPELPVLVMNGDVLTKINYSGMLDFHTEHESVATMAVRHCDFQIPYGVVEIDDHRVKGLIEKPVQSFWVNSGIYVLDPSVIDRIPTGEYCDMTTLFEQLIQDDANICSFPISEYWIDVGRQSDFEQAQQDYLEMFRT